VAALSLASERTRLTSLVDGQLGSFCSGPAIELLVDQVCRSSRVPHARNS
jgi:hypothetical protein